MSKGQISLTVTVQAEWMGEEFLPDSTVREMITLTFPLMEEKFVVFPKIMEGVTFGVVESHRRKVESALYEIEKVKKEKEKLEQWTQGSMPVVSADTD